MQVFNIFIYVKKCLIIYIKDNFVLLLDKLKIILYIFSLI